MHLCLRLLILSLALGFLSAALPIAPSCHAQADGQWWKRLHAPLLDSLMEVALCDNLSIQVAQERMRQAQAVYRASWGAFSPQVSVATGWSRQGTSRRLTEQTTPLDQTSYYSAMASGTLTIDVFGQLRKTSEAKRAAWKASRMNYEEARLSMCASIVKAYLGLCATQTLMRVMRQNIGSQQEVVLITEARYEAGLASKLDVTQALSTLHNTQSGIAAYQSQQVAYESQLAVLMGRDPYELRGTMLDADSLPEVDLLIDDKVDLEVVKRRPDLMAAEWELMQLDAEYSVARKQWLPEVSVKGNAGLMAHELGKLFHHEAYDWQVAPTLQWNLFTGGQRVENIREARAAWRAQWEQYQQLLLTALEELEQSATAYEQGVAEAHSLQAAMNEALESLSLSTELYKMGLSAFINVLQAQQAVLQYEISYVNACQNALNEAVNHWVAQSPGLTTY